MEAKFKVRYDSGSSEIIEEISALLSSFGLGISSLKGEDSDDFIEYQITKIPCKHKATQVRREGMSGTLGTVVCLDCGYERDWDAY